MFTNDGMHLVIGIDLFLAAAVVLTASLLLRKRSRFWIYGVGMSLIFLLLALCFLLDQTALGLAGACLAVSQGVVFLIRTVLKLDS